MDATNNDKSYGEATLHHEEARCTGDVRLCDVPGMRFQRIGHCRTERRILWVYGVSRVR
jgi:hypothetical protein